MAQVLFTGYGEQLIAAATNVTNSTKDSVTKRKAQRTPAYAISTLIYRASYVPGDCISEIAWARFHRWPTGS